MRFIYEAEGKNRAEAEKAALDALDIKENQVEFEAADGAKTGILSFVSRKPVVLRVYPNENTPMGAVIRGVILSMIEKMGIDARVLSVGDVDGNIYVELTSTDSGILIGKHGRTLDALQFLCNLLVDNGIRDNRRIMIDVESYREKRQRSLNRLARGVATRVHRSGQSQILDYMNPYERRVIHLALEDDDRVFTRSEGNGVYKRVRVIPADMVDDYDREAEETA